MYCRPKTITVIVVLMLPAIRAALAADIDLVLTVNQQPNGTAQWELSAAARNAADNDGIAGFNVDLVGIANAHHTSPLVASNPDFVSPIAGFTIGGVDLSDDGAVFATQNQFVPGFQIYGVGEPGAKPPIIGPSFFARNIPWDHPVTLATGTAETLLGPAFGQSANMTVWSQGEAAIGGVKAEFATIFPSIARIPFGVNEWITRDGGSWNTATNWRAGVVPHLFGAQARFGDAISSPATVRVDSSVVVDRIEFDNNIPYTITSAGTPSITLSGNATIHVAAGSHTIAAPLAGTNGLNKSGPGTLVVSGPKVYSGKTSILAGSLIVQNQGLPGETIDVAAGATLRLQQFVNYQLQPRQTLVGSGRVLLEHTFSNTDLIIPPTSAVRGSLNIQADNVVNSGLVAPGFSPGIIRIDGDYTQENDGVLEIEVGGLTPGTQHDQLQVTSSASLGGRIEIPLINGFVPTAGSEIQFLTAESIDGLFNSVFSPNLSSVAPGLAIDVVEPQGRIRFVNIAPPGTVQFTSQQAVTSWHAGETWSQTPGTTHPVLLANRIGQPQVVEVSGASAFTHQLILGGDSTNTITIAVEDANLSATAGITIQNRGIIELDDGSLVSSNTLVQSGGRLVGNGTVVGNLILGGPSGSQPATLSPGFSVGHVDVEGDYQQGVTGTLVIEVEGDDAGQFDTVSVTGEATLGGTLVVDANAMNMPATRASIEVLTAGSVTPGSEFDSVETVGGDGVYFAPTYSGTSASLDSHPVGDMNRDFALNGDDVPEFALALRNPLAYRARRGLFGSQSGNMDGANGLDFSDIDDFAMALEVAGMANAMAAVQSALLEVPESNTLLLALLAMFAGCGLWTNYRR